MAQHRVAGEAPRVGVSIFWRYRYPTRRLRGPQPVWVHIDPRCRDLRYRVYCRSRKPEPALPTLRVTLVNAPLEKPEDT